MAVPAAQGGVGGPPILPPPRARPRPAPRRVVVQAPTLPPIIRASAPPARHYAPQAAAHAYRAAPHHYRPVATGPSALPPPTRGHWIVDKGQATLIHAVGPGRWVKGGVPGYPAAPPPASMRAPSHTDVTSGGYDFARADAYKKTPAYHQAVLDVFRHQDPHQQQAIIAGAARNRASPEAKMIRDYVSQRSQFQKKVGDIQGGGLVSHTGQALSGALGAIEGAVSPHSFGLPQGSYDQIAQRSGVGPGSLGRVIVHTPVNVARAFAEKPAAIPATVKGLGEIALGALPGIATAVQHPGRVLQAGAADYAARYGPVAAGNDRAAINRIKASPQGAAPEVTDIIGAAGGLDVTAGRAVAATARTARRLGHEGAIVRHFTEPRPGLRVAGGGVDTGAVRAQTLAPGAMKITAQRLEDAWRRAHGKPAAGETPRALPAAYRKVVAGGGRGEIVPRAGEVVPLFGKRAQRIAVSKISARTREKMLAMGNRELRARKGALGNYANLKSWEKRAFPFAVEGGIPLRSGPDVARQWIDRHIALIERDRAGSKFSLGNRIPEQYREALDNIPMLQALRANAEKWATPRLADMVDREGARRMRIDQRSAEVGGLDPQTAEARALRAQGELFGHEHPNTTIDRRTAELEKRHAELTRQLDATMSEPKPGQPAPTIAGARAIKAEMKTVQRSLGDAQTPEARRVLLEAYIAKVRADAKQAGMPAEPGYLRHRQDPKVDFSAYTSGAGGRAMPGVEQSRFALWRGGAVDRSIHAYADGLARSIKRPFQWRLVDDQMRQARLETGPQAIEAALKRKADPAGLTPHELHQVLAHGGAQRGDYMIVNPGRLRASTLQDIRDEATPDDSAAGGAGAGAPSEVEASDHLRAVLDRQAFAGDAQVPEEFAKTRGWFAIPREAYDEIYDGLKPSGKGGRLVGKAQGLTAMAILGGSPSFAVLNSLAEGIMATAATRGKIFKDALDYPLWFRNLPDADKDAFRAESHGRVHFRPEKMGSVARGHLTNQWRDLQTHKLMRTARAANPIRVLFSSQAHFSDFLRHTALYSEMKHQALANMGGDMSGAAHALEHAQQMFHIGPTTPVREHLDAILHSQPALEAAGEKTLSMLGDYTRFTAGERRFLNNRAILFYSFLRYATRTLFYTLPLKHPIITGLVAELSKLHGDEVRKLLGGQDLPWAYSRLFFGPRDNLRSIDTQRFSPVGSLGTDIATRGIQGAAQTITPEVQILLDQIYGQTSSGAPHPRGPLSALDDLLSLSYPYRAGKLQYFGTQPQQPGSIPLLHERPDVKKTTPAQTYQQAKIKAGGTLAQRQLASATGLVPKPDTSMVIAAERIRKQLVSQRTAAAKAKTAAKRKSGASIFGGGAPPKPANVDLAQILRQLQHSQPTRLPAKQTAASGSIWGGASAGASTPSGSIWGG